MRNKATKKDFYREIKGSLGRFLSIFFIVALGVAFFSGIRASQPAMIKTGDAYFDENRLMDIKIISTLGLSEKDVKAVAAVDGVESASGGYSVDVLCSGDENQKVIHIMSLTDGVNDIKVLEGRLPKKDDECLIDADSDYRIGDVIQIESGTDAPVTDTLKKDQLTVVGRGASACYISFGKGSSMIGTGSVSAFAVVPEKAFCMDVYTEIYVQVEGATELTAYTEEYDVLIETVLNNVEDISEKCAKLRTEEVISEANEEVDKAQEDLDEAKEEVAAELADAWTKITDGERQLNHAKWQIADGERQLDDAENLLVEKQKEIDAGKVQYEEGLEEYEKGLILYQAEYEKYAVQIEQYESLKEYYELNKEKLPEEQKAYLEAQLKYAGELLKPLYDTKASLEQGKIELDMVKIQLEEGQAQILEGWEEIREKKADLVEAKKKISSSEAELNDAKAEYSEGKQEAEEEIADAEREIADAREEIENLEAAKWYVYDRSVLPEHEGLGDNAERIGAIGEVFPVLFFLVAALISLTSMTRMVEEQRTQIGTMKALGYGKFAISAKYLGYALVATLGGSVLGVLVGEKIIPWVITYAYCVSVYEHITNYILEYDLYYAVLATVAALFCTLAATIFSCYKELTAQPAVLMRPPAPKKGKRVLLERVTFVWKRLSFIWKSTVRNLFRYKKRFFMTIFGIGGCMALLLLGFGIKDSIGELSKSQFTRIQIYDGMAYLQEDAAQEDMEELDAYLNESGYIDKRLEMNLSNVTLVHGSQDWDVYMSVPEDKNLFEEFVVTADRITKERYLLTDEGVILTEKAAKMLEAEVGDKIEIQDQDNGNHEVIVSAICENYMGHYCFMTKELYEKLYETSYDANCVYFKTSNNEKEFVEEAGTEILKKDAVLNVSYLYDQESRMLDILETLDIVVFVLIISAALLAFVVLYNLNNINITERRRELATLKVLGFYDGEVSAYVYRENIILTFIGAVVGVILGIIVHQFVIVTVEVEAVMFGRVIYPMSFVYSVILTFVFSAFVNWIMYFRLKKIDMVESLKSVE